MYFEDGLKSLEMVGPNKRMAASTRPVDEFTLCQTNKDRFAVDLRLDNRLGTLKSYADLLTPFENSLLLCFLLSKKCVQLILS